MTKILVVDDDENSRVYLERALKSQSYTVEGAANGALALEMAMKSQPDIIISDAMMPEMNGFEFCRKVKEDKILAKIPFVFYTATFTDKNDRELARSLGASRYIVKPVEMEDFFSMIKEVIEELKCEKPVAPEQTAIDQEKIGEMYSRTITRKLEEKVNQLQESRQKLQEALEYTRTLIEVSPDPLVTISSKGRITDVNEATISVTGLSREKLIGSDFSDYFTEPEKAREGYRQAFEKGSVRDYPLAIRHVSGRITYVLYNAAVYRDAAGNIAGIFAAARDITERKHAEDELREKNKNLETMITGFVGQEARMAELKKTNLKLMAKLESKVKDDES